MATKRYELLEISPSDIDGRTAVVVTITPEMPQDTMMQMQVAQALRTPGVDGLPIASDRYIRESVLKMEHPDIEAQRIKQQMLPAQNQEISKVIMAAAEADWRTENPETVKKAEKIQNPDGLPDLKPEQLRQIMSLLQKMSGGAQGLEAMLAQAEGGMMPGLAGAMGAGPGPGGGPMPGALPSQFMMTPEEALPEPATLPASQARRGKAAN